MSAADKRAVTSAIDRVIALTSLARGAIAEADEESDADKADRLRNHAYETLSVAVEQAERLREKVAS